jgi:hypothetical protein
MLPELSTATPRGVLNWPCALPDSPNFIRNAPLELNFEMRWLPSSTM